MIKKKQRKYRSPWMNKQKRFVENIDKINDIKEKFFKNWNVLKQKNAKSCLLGL